MPLVQFIKKIPSLISYVVSSDELEPKSEDGKAVIERRASGAGNWLRWLVAGEDLPEEGPPKDLRPATRGIWFLGSDPFPSDLPVPEKAPGFWSWVLKRESESDAPK
ncbi:MAG: hypothetical protein P1V51_06780 [Deltaproteobacteria bacterium]|nr:hypothetical protein [Deltaproteobacteria bacterium]